MAMGVNSQLHFGVMNAFAGAHMLSCADWCAPLTDAVDDYVHRDNYDVLFIVHVDHTCQRVTLNIQFAWCDDVSMSR